MLQGLGHTLRAVHVEEFKRGVILQRKRLNLRLTMHMILRQRNRLNLRQTMHMILRQTVRLNLRQTVRMILRQTVRMILRMLVHKGDVDVQLKYPQCQLRKRRR